MAMFVGFANDKGGCGKTTLAAHVLWWAHENRIQAFGVTLDPQGNLVQRLMNDPALQIDRIYRFSPFVEVQYSPHHAPNIPEDKQLVVFDFPPGLNKAYKQMQMHLWGVPIDNREALEGLVTAARTRSFRVLPGGPGIVAIVNMYDGAGIEPVDAAREGIRATPGVRLWQDEIPDSSAIQRSAEFRMPTWKVPKGKGTIGDAVMQRFCSDMFRMLGLSSQAPSARKERSR